MVAHQLSEHEKTENFACTKCEYNSKKEYDLKLHISTNHPVYPRNKCDFRTEGQNQVENSYTYPQIIYQEQKHSNVLISLA